MGLSVVRTHYRMQPRVDARLQALGARFDSARHAAHHTGVSATATFVRTPSVEIVEVGPRDGLQTESRVWPIALRAELITRLEAAGARRIEVGSFVNPQRVPQMAEPEALLAALPKSDAVRIGLVLNLRGAERAIAAGIDELGAVCVASDAFGLKNQRQTSRESLAVAREIVALGNARGRRAQITIAVAFGCPYAGEVSPDHVVALAGEAAAVGAREIGLADTLGVAVPHDVESLVARVVAAVHPLPVRVHLHDTRGTGIANVWAAIRAGARAIDAAVGGLGGCPFAPGAGGNVASEDVAYLLQRSGIAHGFDIARLHDTSSWLAETLGRSLPGRLSRVPTFPPPAKEPPP